MNIIELIVNIPIIAIILNMTLFRYSPEKTSMTYKIEANAKITVNIKTMTLNVFSILGSIGTSLKFNWDGCSRTFPYIPRSVTSS